MSRIWLYALGYFVAYVPYSALTKALTAGIYPASPRPVPGLTVLPITVAASAVAMLLFLTGARWWRYARRLRFFGRSVPCPGRATLLSGLCTAAIIGTTTLAYTFDGVSIVFVMLLMRGGVLVLAPVVDSVTGRPTHWYSWAGLGLSLTGLLIAFAERDGYAMTWVCALDVAVYLSAYFARLRFMSREAKSSDETRTRQFFVEEQMVAAPATLLFLALAAGVGWGPAAAQLRAGFTDLWTHPVLPAVLTIGVCSQATGVFGGLILLDRRETTYTVPVNRSSSILAGIVATVVLSVWLGSSPPSPHQLIAAAAVVAAVIVLGASSPDAGGDPLAAGGDPLAAADGARAGTRGSGRSEIARGAAAPH